MNNHNKCFFPSWYLATAIATVVAAQAGAQEADSAIDDAFVLEEIVILAEKRGEGRSVMDTGFAITGVSGDQLEHMGADSIQDALAGAPGVNFTQTTGANEMSIQIRGISSDFGDATVGYYFDDLPFTLINTSHVPDINPFDLQQVEILRGPQGTLYGAGSSSGAVIVRTQPADTSDYEVKLDISGSNTEGGGSNYGVNAALNVPVIDEVLGLRFVVGHEDNGGYVDNVVTAENDFNDSERTTVRARLTYTPTDNLEVRGSVWHSEADAAPGFSNADYVNTSINLLIPQGNSGLDYFDNSQFSLYNTVIEYSFDGFDLYSTTSYIESEQQRVDGLTTTLVDLAIDRKNEAISQEIRLSSTGDGAFSWNGGLFYLKGEQDDDATLFTQPPAPSQAIVGFSEHYEDEQWAVFAEVHWTGFSDILELTAGLRYVEDERTAVESAPANAAAAAFLGVDNPRKEENNDITPRFNATARWSEDFLTYINLAKGFRPGAHNYLASELSAFPNGISAADPEELWTYEVGTKVTLLDGDFSFEGALYFNDWSDVQVFQTFIVNFGGIPTPVLVGVNGGNAESYGVDANFVYTGISGLRLQVGGNVNSSEYLDTVGTAPAQIPSGSRIQQVPKYTLSAAADYQWSIASDDSGLQGVFHLDIQHVDEKPSYSVGSAYSSDKITLLNARIGVEGDNWGVFLFGENLLGEDGLLTSVPTSIDPGILGPRSRPATFGLNVKYQY
ncbi:TonB-dependent receptor plug domain-containing protein [Pseudomaricurvus alkylphenolicus]|uniref:TonB-dependent receptor n=1 Tax=Pseudomaricurvus alkylphenolicus TaxID=1306991 RepID=UPI00141F5515|nr:TonB-dependent receptor plug domain-containing protein [Pseudomaricurvus alkylphenolicus]NIB38172.1 TonB-dependent receptor plug domain-containing protein [Pseudomaricurvus alkylphenolicus]